MFWKNCSAVQVFATESEAPEPAEIQVPLTEKHPLVRSIPLAKVEEAELDVMLRVRAERPAAKVEVPCPADTVSAAPKVEVALPEIVVVAVPLPA